MNILLCFDVLKSLGKKGDIDFVGSIGSKFGSEGS